MAENETKVLYRAIADFTALGRSVRKAKKDIADLRREEAKLNAQSVAGSAAATAATGKHSKSREDLIDTFEKEAGSVRKSTAQFIENSKAVKENDNAIHSNAHSVNLLTGEISEADTISQALTNTVRKAAQEHVKTKKVVDDTTLSYRRNRTEINKLQQGFNNSTNGVNRLHKGLDKLDDWRPRLVPPFIALIPLIASVIALINPLVAGLGAVGAAGLGFASSLGRVAAGAIGAIPALVTLISVVAALKTSFGGIGNAFKAFGAMQKAASGGGGGGGTQKEELTRTEQLQRAQENLAHSIQDVSFAQEDLDDARKGYIKRLRELQKAVDRTAQSEARAAANSQLASENYMNVMADPGSTKGEKMDAQVSVSESQSDQQDVIDDNKQNAIDLAKMQKDGIDGDRDVVMATRKVTDALWAQRDAQLALANTIKGTNDAAGGGASAANAYQDALNKLSPSARRFVEELVAMKDAWDAVKKDVQESFFSEFVGDIQLLRKLMPSVNSLLSNTAGALGRVVDRFLKLITSPKWQSDLVLIGEQNVPIIENIGDALLSWVDAFKDLAIIAGPFFTELTKGLKDGAKGFQDLVANARANGSLASYLEEVRQRMSQWWRIVKNIGKALFNYSAAAGDFGTWLTDGFEKVTQGWLDSSEKARKEGSPFQKYLEDIKPLLVQVKGLFSDFFSWFARTSADPKNIGGFTDIVKTIRDDLGPALRDLLQSLSDSGIGTKLISSLTSIIESLDSIIGSGGGAGFAAFFDIITNFFKGLADALKNPILGPVLKVIATGLGAITALSFIGKFTGLTTLFGWLLKLSKSQAVLSLLDKLPGIGALASSSGKHVAASGGLKSSLTGLLGKAGGLLKMVGGKLALPLLVITTAISAVGSLVTATSGGKKALDNRDKNAPIQDQIHSVNAGFNEKGSMAKLAVPAAGIASDVIGLFSKEGQAGFDQWLSDLGTGFLDWLTIDLPKQIHDVGTNLWDGLQTIGDWLIEKWDDAVSWFTNLPYAIGFAVGYLWGNLQNFGDWLAEKWNDAVTWFTNLPQTIADTAGDIWRNLQGFGPWLALKWIEFAAWIQTLPQKVRDTAGDIWRNLQGLGPWLALKWIEFVAWLKSLPSKVRDTAGDIWSQLGGVGTWLSNQLASLKTWFRNLPSALASVAGGFVSWVSGLFTSGVSAGQAAAKSKSGGRHNGGPIKRAGGGGVPGSGNSDTVSAMLTPGEFVVRKSIVNRVGEDNMARFNSGVISYSQLLQAAMANQPSNSKSEKKNSGGGGISFFDGGGLVPTMPPGFGGGSTPPGNPSGFGGASGGGGFYVENLIVNNPVPETVSESLPRTIRKLAYVGGRRGGN